MKQNDIKIQPVRNRVAEIYTKVTGSNIIGELMMTAGNGTTETYKFVTAAFECNIGYKAAIAYIFDKTEEDISGHTVTVKYGDDVQTLPFVNESVEAVDAKLAEQISELTGEDYSAYIGWYCGAYFDEYNYREGETYTFNLDGVEVATETGITCEEEPTEDPNPNQSKE